MLQRMADAGVVTTGIKIKCEDAIGYLAVYRSLFFFRCMMHISQKVLQLR